MLFAKPLEHEDANDSSKEAKEADDNGREVRVFKQSQVLLGELL